MSNPLYDSLYGLRERSDRPYLATPDGDAVSYVQFIEMAARLANQIVAMGVRPGDRVAVQAGKSMEALALYVATIQAGAVFLPLNTAYTPAEVGYFLADAEPKLFVCDPTARPSLEATAADSGASIETMAADGSGSIADGARSRMGRFDPVARKSDDVAAILYTSGTTGRSKGAMLTQGNLLSNAQALKDIWRFTERDVLLHALPMFHTHGLFVAVNTVTIAGGSMIWLSGFDTDSAIGHLPSATSMMGVPTFYTRLLDAAGFDRELVGHIRLFTSGSAPLLAETHVAFEQRTGHRILERYGMTETSMSTSNPYDGERRPGTVGFPLPDVELRICDADSGEEKPAGEIGVIEVRGPNVFKGYWRMPEKTREEFRDDGFFITGDLARIDEDGYVHIVGRAKDLIISGGYNIYPKEVELVLDEQDGVLESAVVGVPHADFGEAVVAAVVAKEDAELDEAALLEGIREKIARFKQPKKVHLVSELPRNTMGKVQKNVLRDWFSNDFS